MFLEKLRNRGASDSNKYEEEHTVKKYGVNELRQMFLDFFESKGHLVMNSFSLVPQNDNSLLLINAGTVSYTHLTRKEVQNDFVIKNR